MIFADFMTVFTFAFALLLLALSASAAYGGFRAAPWAPTRKGDEERFLRLAGIKPGQKVYDLGCGDGRMLLSAARAGAIAAGYEVSLLFYFITYFKILRAGLRQNCRVSLRDFWRADLSDADIVYFFLMPKIYPKLKQASYKHQSEKNQLYHLTHQMKNFVNKINNLADGDVFFLKINDATLISANKPEEIEVFLDNGGQQELIGGLDKILIKF